ncbi:amidase (plasmid) [Klebsiella michiganensis]|uniref:amidase n=1 Tax=Klebsiella michiganensis TaxID=1134687 RepID=UPI002659E38D|nr:amidase [Klebsiella michiganensis]WKJ95794.1 amidase [Klebsiella michiganensis]WKK01067.1 amidase [Klebsiella michiganensis]WKK02860.1 amidase [Klebsiella michiganensis]WKK07018.1 amidase [Klebsiella michiganensis]
MKELHYLNLLEVGKRIQSREISSEEVTQTLLTRISEQDAKLHSYVTVMTDQALQEARTADEEIASGKFRGPLQGVPVAVKDLLWTKGVKTTHGMPLNEGFLPQEDATVIKRFQEAGAVMLGKLTQTEGAFADHHPNITPPLNPWGESLWSGASSSGSGVATATGLCFGSIGTDTGGSIRFPSAANGITGLKPTWGRVSRYGVCELAATLDHVGPMTRTVADAAAILQTIAGYDPKDPTSSTEPVPHYLSLMTHGVRKIRIGIDASWSLDRVDDETRNALNHVISTFTSLGAEFVDIKMPDTDQAARDWSPLCAIETAVAHEATFPSQQEKYGPGLKGIIELGHSVTGIEYQKLQLRRAELRGKVTAFFRDVDIILSPVTAFAGLSRQTMSMFGQDENLFSGVLRYTSVFDLTGHPTLTIPCGRTVDNAPIAFQLIASHFDETSIIQAGWAWQQVTNWHQIHPDL